MGMGQEMLDQMIGMYDYAEDYIYEEMRRKRWTTREGKVIRIKQMTDAHLANTIAYLENSNFPWAGDFKEIMERELAKRIDGDFKHV